jgi:putative nucleotidyltransferase with HDIG domain
MEQEREPGVSKAAGPAAPSPASDPGPASGEFDSARSRLFFVAQVVIASVLLVTQAPRVEGDLWLLGLLIVCNVLAGMMPIVIYGETSISVGHVPTIAISMLYGVPGVVIAGPWAALPRLLRHNPDLKLLTNAARFVAVNALTAASYQVLATSPPQAPSLLVVAAAIIASVAAFAASLLLVMVSANVRTGQSLRSSWEKNVWVAPHYVVMGLLGFGLATAYVALGYWGIITFLMPLALVRLAMKQYVDKTQENVKKVEEQLVAIKKANVEILRVSEELQDSYDGTLEALVNALDARDQETKGHSLRVSHYMMRLAADLGVKAESSEWENMRRGSLLHDVGKIGVTDLILLKEGRLTEDEWHFMRQHPAIGYEMLRQVKFLSGAAEIVLAHHERWDGEGYPRRLSGLDIPFGARIFAVADTFDAMTSDRPYRRALSPAEAFREIRRGSGSQFDPSVVEAFLDAGQRWAEEVGMAHERFDIYDASKAHPLRAS